MDRFGVRTAGVPARHLDTGMLTQPRLERVGLAVGQHIDALAGDRVDQDGGINVGVDTTRSRRPRARGAPGVRVAAGAAGPAGRYAGTRSPPAPTTSVPRHGQPTAAPPHRPGRSAGMCGAGSDVEPREAAPGTFDGSPASGTPADVPAPAPPPAGHRPARPRGSAGDNCAPDPSRPRSPDRPPALRESEPAPGSVRPRPSRRRSSAAAAPRTPSS